MTKIVLILVLCLPLGLVALHECWRLQDEWRHPIDVDGDDLSPSDAEKEAWAKAEEKAKEVLTPSETPHGRLPVELVRSTVALDDPPEIPPDITVPAAAQAVNELRRVRNKHRDELETEQADSIELAQKIEAELEKLRGDDGRPRNDSGDSLFTPGKSLIDNLTYNLNAYGKKSVFDADLVASARAEVEWPELDKENSRQKLDELYAKIDRWKPQRPVVVRFDPGAEESHAEKYKAYFERHNGVKGNHAPLLVGEAKLRYRLWHLGKELVEWINDWSGEVPTGTEAARIRAVADANRIRAVAELASTDNPSEKKFVDTARRVARRLCADLVPDEVLDARVSVNDGGSWRKVLRSSLRIRWKDGTKVTLKDSGFDEWSLKPKLDDVADFEIGSESIAKKGTDPLKPTLYSEAVHNYSLVREKIKRWSGEDLSLLQAKYEQYREQLDQGPNDSGKILKARLDALLDVVRRYPSFFSSDPN